MASAQLSASARDNGGKGVARKLRSEGRVPAVVYGHGREPQPLSINTRELERLLDRIAAESTVIDLDIDGKASRTLIREIQRHPFKRQILHVDFQELVAGEKITVRLPIVLIGVPDGVRMDGGVLDQTMRELEVEVDPSNIPNHVELDVTKLVIGTRARHSSSRGCRSAGRRGCVGMRRVRAESRCRRDGDCRGRARSRSGARSHPREEA